MRAAHVKYLACPTCKAALSLVAGGGDESSVIDAGELECPRCRSRYPVVDGVPRFAPMSNYADNWSVQWTKHALTQYDSHTGTTISADRFRGTTGWPSNLKGETILEVGCGSGRFTECALATGATVVSADYSRAIDANHAINGGNENLLLVHADAYALPFPDQAFDRVFCFGVIQSLPDPRKAFHALTRYVKPGGSLVVDSYRIRPGRIGRLVSRLSPTHYVRRVVARLDPQKAYPLVRRYVHAVWPLVCLISRLPGGRMFTNHVLLVSDYRGVFDLSEEALKEWAVLDTFDTLGAVYDRPQTLEAVEGWFKEANASDVSVFYGYNGVVGRGRISSPAVVAEGSSVMDTAAAGS